MSLLSCVVWSFATAGNAFKTFGDSGWLFSSRKCLTFLGTGLIWISGKCDLIVLNLLASNILKPFEDDPVSELILNEWVGLVWRRELATASMIWLVLKSTGERVWVKLIKSLKRLRALRTGQFQTKIRHINLHNVLRFACSNLLVWMPNPCGPLLCPSGYQLWTGLYKAFCLALLTLKFCEESCCNSNIQVVLSPLIH